MTYNFDPDRWYANELAALKVRYNSGEISARIFEEAVAELDRRYDEMFERLNGSYQIPK
jgi:hypothetical protein